MHVLYLYDCKIVLLKLGFEKFKWKDLCTSKGTWDNYEKYFECSIEYVGVLINENVLEELQVEVVWLFYRYEGKLCDGG